MRLITRILFFCLLAFFVKSANASHVSGGDITYECLGNNKYIITLNLFRDCSGIELGIDQKVKFRTSCGEFTESLPLVNLDGTEISQLCANQIVSSSCNVEGSSIPGMKRYTYKDTVTLNSISGCDDWTIHWNTFARNASTNLLNSDDAGIYIEAKIENALTSCNSSPSFSSPPIPYVCAGAPVDFNFGAIETQGDSLTFAFISARDTNSVNLSYTGGASGVLPIAGITINAATGQINFTPASAGIYVVVVFVREYDSNGNLIGTIMRDIQFVVQACSNIPPSPNQGSITNLSGTATQTGNHTIELCEGNYFSFDITFQDDDTTDTLTLSSNISSVLPGATLTTTGTNPVIGNVSWMPPAGSANSNNLFTITVSDGACPVPGQQTIIYYVNVFPRTLTNDDIIICGNQETSLHASGGNVFTWYDLSGNLIPVNSEFSCNPCQDPIVKPNTTITYVVESDLNSVACYNKDTIKVTRVNDFNFTTSQTEDSICRNESVSFNIVPDAGSYSYTWTDSTYLDNVQISNPTATITSSGNINFPFVITSSDGCSKKDTIKVTVSNSANPDVSIYNLSNNCTTENTIPLSVYFSNQIPVNCGISTLACVGSESSLILGNASQVNSSINYPAPYGNYFKNAKHQFLIRKSELNAMGFSGGKISELAFNIDLIDGATTYYGYTINIGCTNQTSLSGTWIGGLSTVFTPKAFNITTGWNTHTFDNLYEWDGNSNLVIEICYNNLAYDYTNNSQSQYTTTSFVSSQYYTSDSQNACSATSSASTSSKRPNIRFKYCSSQPPATNYSYHWYPSNAVSDSMVAAPIGTLSNTYNTFSVVVKDIVGGCSDSTSITIIKSPDFTFTATPDTGLCLNSSLNLNVNASNGTFTYIWQDSTYLDNGHISNPTATINESGIHKMPFEIINQFGCSKKDTINVNVSQFTAPDITIFSGATNCFSGSSTQLAVNFGTMTPISCGLTSVSCSGSTIQKVIGTGTTVNSISSYPAPYGNWYKSAKHQILYTKAELNAMGFFGGKISEIAFNVTTNTGTTTYNQYTIKLGCTNQTNLNGTWVGGLSTVYTPKTHTVITGWNLHSLDNIYEWDGNSNLVVEICFNNLSTGYTDNAQSLYSTTTFTSVQYQRSDDDNECNATTTYSTDNKRPNTRFTFCSSVPLSNYSYLWYPANSVNNPTISNPTVTTNASSAIFSVVVKDVIGGCTDSATIQLFSNPIVTINAADTICNSGSPITLTATTNATPGTWSGPGITNPVTGIFDPTTTSSGNQTISYTSTNNNCSTTVTTTVVVVQNPIPPQVILTDTVCEGLTMNPAKASSLSGLSNSTFNWYSNIDLSQLIASDSIFSGSYIAPVTVFVTETNTLNSINCVSLPKIYTIPFYMPGSASFTAAPLIGKAPLDVTFTNTSSIDMINFKWNFGDEDSSYLLSPTYKFMDMGEYSVLLTGTDQKGCIDTSEVIITVEGLEIPNIFTPNGDQFNETFKVNSVGLKDFSCMIFDRWGKKVAELNSSTEQWDGGDAQSGTYFYIVKGLTATGEAKTINGFVTLIR